MIKELKNNKGYMLIEIILASVIALGVATFLISLTIKLKNKNDDLLVEMETVTDQTIIMNKLMNYVKNEKNNFDCDKLISTGQNIKYRPYNRSVDETIDIVNEYANIGTISCETINNTLKINVPLKVTQQSDKNYDVVIYYKLSA